MSLITFKAEISGFRGVKKDRAGQKTVLRQKSSRHLVERQVASG